MGTPDAETCQIVEDVALDFGTDAVPAFAVIDVMNLTTVFCCST